MQGQWLGSLDGLVSGTVMVDLEDRGDRFTGVAFFTPAQAGVPSTIAFIDTKAKADKYEFDAAIRPVDNKRKEPMELEQFAENFFDVMHDLIAKITLELKQHELHVSYSTTVSNASGKLLRFTPEAMSSYQANEELSWGEFKAYLSKINIDRHVFRGQASSWSLRTSFNRTGRCDLWRYKTEDIYHIQRELLPYTSTFLDVKSPILTGGLYNLAQHHGYPTPILDWTYSPYIAAFHAFRKGPSHEIGPDHKARLFAFDRTNWENSADGTAYLTCTDPHVTFLDLAPIENKRALPQQALSMVTNLDNIEQYIKFVEGEKKLQFLTVVDIPWSERPTVMRDLRIMGITAASMFPGLDGTFEELKHRLDSCDARRRPFQASCGRYAIEASGESLFQSRLRRDHQRPFRQPYGFGERR